MMLKCAACQSTSMSEGFLEDGGQNAYGYTRWISGPIKIGVLGAARRMGREKRPVLAYRCNDCSHVQLYATTWG